MIYYINENKKNIVVIILAIVIITQPATIA